MVKNSSWGEKHVSTFGNRDGYVICHNNNTRELVAVASVIGIPSVPQEEITANAKLIASAPKMLAALIEIAEGKGRYNEDRLTHAENIIEDMVYLAKEAIKFCV